MTGPLVVIQARTSSRRLPAKALVSFRGQPLAVLAAQRAASRGASVVMATSIDPSDDLLAATAAGAGVTVVRGSLDNVLERFCDELGDSPDDRAVVRLTGDNIVPDGDLIAEVVAALEAAGADYITTTDPAAGLPYGVSVEVTRAGWLRAARRGADTSFEREHVMPWIRERAGVKVFDVHADLAKGGFRATIDCFDDLMSMHRIFPETDDPVTVPWRILVDRLHLGLYQPGPHIARGDLVLGTAQFGMPYGINRAGEPTSDEGRDIIRHAIANGVRWIDTARAYGDSERVVGSALATGWLERCRLVTKIAPLADWTAEDSPKGARAAAKVSLLSSAQALDMPRLDTVMLHRWAHWGAWGGAVADLLREEREAGRLGAIGASIQSPDELSEALDAPEITHVQVPFNILDARWDALAPRIEAARAGRGLIVHVRSALLQGLLLSDDSAKWHRAHVSDPAPVRDWLREAVARHGRADVLDLCLAFARAVPWVDGVVVGMDDLDQLRANLESFAGTPLSPEAMADLARTRPPVADETLDPARWRPA